MESRVLRQGHFSQLAARPEVGNAFKMLMLGWTTVGNKTDADRLAEGLVAEKLAACVQVDGPIDSVYIWAGKVEHTQEYRLLIKFIPARGRSVEEWLHAHHPYDTPEWVVIRAEDVGEKYLSWARANSTSAPL